MPTARTPEQARERCAEKNAKLAALGKLAMTESELRRAGMWKR